MEGIEEQIDEKLIERDTTTTSDIIESTESAVVTKPVKIKKERSPAQIAAFEKARIKRNENYQKRKALKENPVKTIIKETIPEKLKPELSMRATEPLQAPAPTPWQAPMAQQPMAQQPIVNNYYYGHPPPDHQTPTPRGRKKKKVYYSSSSEEEEEEVEIQPVSVLKNYNSTKKNNILFKYTH